MEERNSSPHRLADGASRAKPHSRRRFGPGLLVTAAFIGPGTITTASRAGAGFGFALAWAIVFSVVAAIVLQEMAARVGLVTRGGLGEAIRAGIARPAPRFLAVLLVVAAIAIGNAAYQTGNLTGAALGLEVLTGLSRSTLSLLIALVAGILLATGSYRIIERALIAMVVLMSGVFLVTAAVIRPDVAALLRGMLVPAVPEAGLVATIALIGTTVVPYNLFLHASVVREKWPADAPIDYALRDARRDTILAVVLGGIVTLSVMVTATSLDGGFSDAAAMARQLEPLLGAWAKWFFAVGLMAAGITSAMTAPLAAAYATCGALGWPVSIGDTRFRLIWGAVLAAGAACAVAFGSTPVQAIVFAQATNGLILPIMAVFLLIVVNRASLMGAAVNRPAGNVLGIAVVFVAASLGIWKLYRQFFHG